MKEIIINVKGMVCDGCEKRVKNSIKAIKGVKKVEADHKTGIVTVSLKEQVDEVMIKETINNIGFEVI